MDINVGDYYLTIDGGAIVLLVCFIFVVASYTYFRNRNKKK